MPRYEYPGYKSSGEGWLDARPGTKGGYHGGTDSPARAGTPVYAEHGGKVFRSGPINGYGMSVIVKSIAPDGTPFYELYGHLGPGPLPDPGGEIAAGQPIPGAVIGETGYVNKMGGISTGPHLHREIISGKVRLNEKGGLGLYSSEVKHRADPDTFDINHPVFPYENDEPLPPLVPPTRSRLLITPRQSAPLTRPTDRPNANSPPTNNPPPSQFSPSVPIPGAAGPTSIGGPNGPMPVVPPVSLPPQLPLRLIPRSEKMLPEQHLNSTLTQYFRLFASGSPSPSDISTALQGTYAPLGNMSVGSEGLPRPSRPGMFTDTMTDAGSDDIWAGSGGLPGLLARVTEQDAPNPFGRELPEDSIPVRRLISRLAQY
ncbi:conserved hypothetical protein; putative metalloendopeptidase related [Bradyrhizobium sp. STM 3843]|uniref:M23 family metallopeptidase n=1 Tax=Bradyrhizobium sp. STM 3843 TaxID=551947 RepID=UPI000240A3E4|nr:M23 family metallopeptidase [Bradyrhizobium sp. STM 3843]CCE04119.1 conserved hypothetical protein; putative metalloendopeptidase related [Bradyrhizobium sp. STM 3843]